jgi:hypothetical protein
MRAQDVEHDPVVRAVREALELVRSAARSDYLGWGGVADEKMERATAKLVEALRA